MARYHCDRVSEELQKIAGVQVTDMTRSSWTFQQDGARLNLRVLPGCCGILLVYNLSGDAKKLSRLLRYVQRAALKTNFGAVLMTLRSDSPLRKLLLDIAWKATKFVNPRTRNEVEVFLHEVPAKLPKKKEARIHEDA